MELSSNHLQPKTYVLLDPTSQDGESSLEMLGSRDVHASLVVLLRHPSSSALKAFAESEGIDLSTAGARYLDDVAERITSPKRVVETVVVYGADPAAEFAQLVAFNETRRVIIPGSFERLWPSDHLMMVDGTVPCEVTAPLSKWGPFFERNKPAYRRGKARLKKAIPSEPQNRMAMFGAVAEDELRRLDAFGTTVRFAANTDLIRLGASGKQCVFVLDGGLTVRREGQLVADLGPGQIAGEMALLTGMPCNADVVAAADSVVIVMNHREFADMLDSCPGVARNILRTAIDRFATAS